MTDSNRQTDHHEKWFTGKIVSRWWKHWCSTRPLDRTVQLFCCLSIFRIEIKTMIGSQTQWMIETIGHPSQIFSFCFHLLKRLWNLKTSIEFSLNWWHLGCPACSHLAFLPGNTTQIFWEVASNKNNMKKRFFGRFCGGKKTSRMKDSTLFRKTPSPWRMDDESLKFWKTKMCSKHIMKGF